MIFVKDIKAYAKVWKVERHEKYTELRISTSEKNDDGTYRNSNWFARLIGHAHNALSDLAEGDKIVITKCKFTNETYTAADGTKKSSFKFLILEAAKDDGNNNTGSQKASDYCPW